MHEQAGKEETLRRISEIETLSDHVEQHCQFGMHVLSHVDVYFQQGSIELKQKILGSIFPGKLVFEKGKYRTSGLNPALALILQKNSNLENEKPENSFFVKCLPVVCPCADSFRTFKEFDWSQILLPILLNQQAQLCT